MPKWYGIGVFVYDGYLDLLCRLYVHMTAMIIVTARAHALAVHLPARIVVSARLQRVGLPHARAGRHLLAQLPSVRTRRCGWPGGAEPGNRGLGRGAPPKRISWSRREGFPESLSEGFPSVFRTVFQTASERRDCSTEGIVESSPRIASAQRTLLTDVGLT